MINSTNLLELLEKQSKRLPEKIAYYDDKRGITFSELEGTGRRIGSSILLKKPENKTIALMIHPRSIVNVEAVFGVLYAGCAYAPLDIAMPEENLSLIMDLLLPDIILADEMGMKTLNKMANIRAQVLSVDEAKVSKIEEELLGTARAKAAVTDPVSILYTSGTTGIPKGSVMTHYGYLHWAQATIDEFGFDESDIFAGQSPYFYANSATDLYMPVALGAVTYLLPSGILSFPRKMIECMNREKITEITMTPSSFVAIAKAGLPEKDSLPYLRHGITSGETMPWAPLTQWMDATPNAAWWHFYGSTEMFAVAAKRVEVRPEEGDKLPVGETYPGTHIVFIDEDGNEALNHNPGEMYVSSPWLSTGYHRDVDRTKKSWIKDPLGKGDSRSFYRSGDIGYINEKGELFVLGRVDSQIKHKGYRMELGEVETALGTIEGWQEGCVLYQKETEILWCIYSGPLSEKEIKGNLRKKLADYKLPDKYLHVNELPYTPSMKLDRKEIRKMVYEL